MHAEVTTEVSDDSADVDVSFHGNLCGYDADAVVRASAGVD